MSLRVAIIGGGNVATHFFKSLGEPTVKQIFVRKKEKNSWKHDKPLFLCIALQHSLQSNIPDSRISLSI